MEEKKALPTIWQLPDELWDRIKPIILEADPPKHTGRKRKDARAVLDAIIYHMRTGCQWNQLPKQFPDDSTVHRTFQKWVNIGLFDKIWAAIQNECQELGCIDWQWQSADTSMGKARFGGMR